MDETTLQFYRQNAQSYADWAKAPSMRLKGFLALLPPGGTILELGCGAGNHAAVMLAEGFSLRATDGSPEMAGIASQRLDHPVEAMVEGEVFERRKPGPGGDRTGLEEVLDQITHPRDRLVELLVPVEAETAALQARHPLTPQLRLAGRRPVVGVDVDRLVLPVRPGDAEEHRQPADRAEAPLLRELAPKDQLVAEPVEVAARMLRDPVHVHLVTISDGRRKVDTRGLHLS